LPGRKVLSVRLTSILNSSYTVSVTSASQPCEAMLNGILMRPSESPCTLLCALQMFSCIFTSLLYLQGEGGRETNDYNGRLSLELFLSLLFIYLFSDYVPCLVFLHLLPYNSVQLDSIFKYLNSPFVYSK